MFLLEHIFYVFFFFNDTATTEIYTLSLHDALPISKHVREAGVLKSGPGLRAHRRKVREARCRGAHGPAVHPSEHQRSEEHTSELQSPCNLVCRLLLEKKKNITTTKHDVDTCVTMTQ